jgi:hypothetical protein
MDKRKNVVPEKDHELIEFIPKLQDGFICPKCRFAPGEDFVRASCNGKLFNYLSVKNEVI